MNRWKKLPYKSSRSPLHRAPLCRVEMASVGHFVLIKSEFSEELVTAEFLQLKFISKYFNFWRLFVKKKPRHCMSNRVWATYWEILQMHESDFGSRFFFLRIFPPFVRQSHPYFSNYPCYWFRSTAHTPSLADSVRIYNPEWHTPMMPLHMSRAGIQNWLLILTKTNTDRWIERIGNLNRKFV